MESVLFDLRDALQTLRRDPIYAITIVLTLALTVGATTAVFSIVSGVLLKPLAYRESHQLVDIREVWRQLENVYPTLPVNEQHFNYWRDRAGSFASMADYRLRPANLTGAGDAVQITLARASGTLFDVLQIGAARGRTLRRQDEAKDSPAVAVISDSLWRQRLGGDSAILGRGIVLDGRRYDIVGVLPPGVQMPVHLLGEAQLTTKVDAFVALPADPDVGWAGDHDDVAIGRLKPGATVEQALAELDVLQGQVSRIASDSEHQAITLRTSVLPLTEVVIGSARRGLWLLLGAIGAVLLIACSNLANLSLTRTVVRLRDAAIRTALGASRGRLIARTILEQVALALTGGVFGVGVAWAALAAFVRTAPIDLPRVADVTLDGRVLGFAAVVSTAAGLLVALLPAWRLAGGDVHLALRAGGPGSTGDRGARRLRGLMLAAQVALSVALLVVTMLLSVSFVRLMRNDRGFSVQSVLAVDVSLPASRYANAASRVDVYDRVLRAIHAIAGVDAASWTSVLPLRGEAWGDAVAADGDRRPTFERPSANYRSIAPEFFTTIGLPIVRGRSFSDLDRDRDRPAPALVSERTAARVWPGRDPLGQKFSRGQPGEQPFQVVGVVADARLTALDRPSPLMVYVPYWWRSYASAALLIHTRGNDSALAGEVRRAVATIDGDIAVGDARPLEQLVDAALASRRYQVALFVAFAVAALGIAVMGVYAVTAYGVSRRRREMNIRAALGAKRSQVIGLVVREAGSPMAAGLLSGTVAAVAASRVVSSLLFDVSARDPFVILPVVALVGGAGLAASLLAARRGLAISPASALRDE